MQVATQSNKVSWTVAAAAGKEWAKKVFPHAASVIPKIETGTAVSNIESILAQSDTIFVGRGDLGLSLGIEKIGIIQKRNHTESTKSRLQNIYWNRNFGLFKMEPNTSSCRNY